MTQSITSEAGGIHTLRLHDLERSDAATAGHKAANLGALARLGLPVPPGVVIAAGEGDEGLAPAVAEAISILGDVPVAVRSSALAEDLEGASFAGQYETLLDVHGAQAIVDAVRRVRGGADDARVAAYRSAHGPTGLSGIAVLLMPMIKPQASGVAFTAHPLTGEREETVVSATKGLGEQLVGGEATGEQWIVRDGRAMRDRRASVEVLDEQQALAVAELARRVEACFDGVPQDIEWAFAEDELYLLQARPMTALPEPVRWESPLPGGLTRNFRLGEWLSEPVTPLTATWLLPRVDDSFAASQRVALGVEPPRPLHVLVNGWYFYSPIGSSSTLQFLSGALIGGLRRPKFLLGTLLMNRRPEVIHRLVYEPATVRWRQDLWPRYQQLVERGLQKVDTADEEALSTMLDGIADIAGEYLFSMTFVAGNAWKMESVLADFYGRHLHPTLGGDYRPLVVGLVEPSPPKPWAIQSFDWFRPTAGELGLVETVSSQDHSSLIEARERAERECRDALSPRLRTRFDAILELAQHYARLREEQVSQLTFGWPLARRALRRLGKSCVRRGVIRHADDVYFLERTEVEGNESRASSVADRRDVWARNRRLSPPLVIGKLPGLITKVHSDGIAKMRMPSEARPGMLEGMPASAGSATGVARVLLDLADADRLAPGEILVTTATTPAWTSVFGRAAAVATDGGSLVAHASLVAREYGIPAVVALGDVTSKVRDGQRITVDGNTGLVELHD
jgi:phosphohistidine swiveling domain-containing protein